MTKMDDPSGIGEKKEPRPLSEAARRALAEAAERRRQYKEAEAKVPTEKGGRGGLEPARYGDWEVKGLTSDF
ncbi:MULTISPECIES: DUF1674 domain-containing protein [Mesorhizobium]|uniref:DUF1674 domain-containing protein n=1 Tax=Mesorhizobium denitrificans TaxID=2294114 RepID=A0A371XCB6_9HYPH|nr:MULTISPECIES: DUF1674 domain-containing protein [Mesorhizobium]RFC66841.1 DUF1674 domain-containing protein [Mesorhizobium denitrificans]